jgi:hypothetical protein
MAPRYRRLLAALLALGLPLGACADDEPAVPDRLTACEVLPRADVEDVLGGAVDEPAEALAATDTLAGRSGCAWTRTDDARAVLVELVRTRDMAASVRRTGFSASARFGAARSEFPDAESVDGLGDRALFVPEEGALHVLVDGSYVTIEVAARPTSAVAGLAEDLGRRAVERIRQADRAD